MFFLYIANFFDIILLLYACDTFIVVDDDDVVS